MHKHRWAEVHVYKFYQTCQELLHAKVTCVVINVVPLRTSDCVLEKENSDKTKRTSF